MSTTQQGSGYKVEMIKQNNSSKLFWNVTNHIFIAL